MSKSFRVRRFANPALLKQIDSPLLVQFLTPHAAYLAGRGVDLSDAHALDYDALAAALADPGDDAPDPLLEAIYFIDEAADDEFADTLLVEAESKGIALVDGQDASPADIAVRLWLADPHVLQNLHAERFLVRPKRFISLLTTGDRLPALECVTDEMVAAMQIDLDQFYEKRKKGRGARVFRFMRDDGVWFLVRHGERLKRQGKIENEQPGSIFYRPEKFDVLIYNAALGELAVHAGSRGEIEAYSRTIGVRVFGDASLFDVTMLKEKYTLNPIRTDGRACLACTDVPGIEGVRLTELQWRYNSHLYHVEIHRSDDVFEALEIIRRKLPGNAQLLRATFKVKFEGAVRERTVVIRPPNIANYDRESDAALVEAWMRKRGFIRTRSKAQIEAKPDAVAARVLDAP
jgi:hypothetical protein